MKKLCLFLTAALFSLPAQALELTVGGFDNGKPIPEKFAFCAPDGKSKTKEGGNINPEIRWSGAPKEAKSFALLVVDSDVPASFDNANKEGKTIAKNAPRQDFYHWVLVNIPADISEIKEGAGKITIYASAITEGKSIKLPLHSYKGPGIAGINDFASFMKDKPAETFIGYDGPCPPWNDERLHRYRFMLFALDVETLPLKGKFGGKEAFEAVKPHVISQAEWMGTFSNFGK